MLAGDWDPHPVFPPSSSLHLLIEKTGVCSRQKWFCCADRCVTGEEAGTRRARPPSPLHGQSSQRPITVNGPGTQDILLTCRGDSPHLHWAMLGQPLISTSCAASHIVLTTDQKCGVPGSCLHSAGERRWGLTEGTCLIRDHKAPSLEVTIGTGGLLPEHRH